MMIASVRLGAAIVAMECVAMVGKFRPLINRQVTRPAAEKY